MTELNLDVQALVDLREAVYRGTGLTMKPSETYVVAKALLAAGWSRPVPAAREVEAATEPHPQFTAFLNELLQDDEVREAYEAAQQGRGAEDIEAATEDVIERAARVVRETRIGPFGPNAREIISQGGTTYLTPAEADEIACALAAAGLLVDGRADAWDEGHAAGYCEGRHAFNPDECAPHENPYRQEPATGEEWPSLPLHRTEAGWPNCATCDGGGCPDCTDPA